MMRWIGDLVSKHLIRLDEDDTGGLESEPADPRYVMLQTIRDYAADLLERQQERDRVHSRHASYFLSLAEEAETHFSSPDQDLWLLKLEVDHDNLRAAIAWALQGHPDDVLVGLRLAAALWRFWEMRGHLTGGRRWLERALSASASIAVEPSARAQALNRAGKLAQNQGDYSDAAALFENSLTLQKDLGNSDGVATCVVNLGNVALARGDYQRAESLFEEGLTLRRNAGDTRGEAVVLNNLGNVAWAQGNREEATQLFKDNLALFRSLGDTRGIAYVLNNLGFASSEVGNHEEATAFYQESLTHLWKLGDRRAVAHLLNNLGQEASTKNDYRQAEDMHRESLRLSRELDSKVLIASALEGLGCVAASEDNLAADLRRAIRFLAAAAALRASLTAPLTATEQIPIERGLEAARHGLPPSAFALTWTEGQSTSIEEIIAVALDE